MPHPSTKFDDQCFYKRQDQWPWLSNRPFLWSYQLTKVSFITLNTSTLKEKNTYVLLKKDLTVQVQISHHTQARFKLPILSFGGQSNALWVALWEGHVEALIWLVHKIHDTLCWNWPLKFIPCQFGAFLYFRVMLWQEAVSWACHVTIVSWLRDSELEWWKLRQ